jgi:maltose/moltooligosaccharide transporter
MTKKPGLSFWQIWNMSFGFLGIQFGFALQNANVSRIFQTLGAEVDDIPILWVAAPVTGLIVQPIIGHMSDKTWGRLGRRRPYFLMGAIFASMALFFMPNSPVLWVAAGMLWIMDASINISMEPFRAFVGDMLPDRQRTTGFAMQSFFIGLGAIIASALPWIITKWLHVSNTAPEGEIAPSVKMSFYIGGAVFLLAVLWTVISTKEYSPDQMRSFQEGIDRKPDTGPSANGQTTTNKTKYFRNSILWILSGAVLTLLFFYADLEKELFILSFGLIVFGLIQLITGLYLKNGKTNGLVEVIEDMFHMPRTMGQLAFVQFFSWFALFAMWIYTTPAVTNHIYNTADTTSQAYNDGADWVGILMAVYNGFAMVMAFLLPVIAKATNRKLTHLIALTCGGAGLVSFLFLKDPKLLIISEIGIGFAWASILSIPYAILTGSLPHNKMGVYMGIFNFFIVIPQILAASILGVLVRHVFHGQAIYALVLGGFSMILAGIITLFVNDKMVKYEN